MNGSPRSRRGYLALFWFFQGTLLVVLGVVFHQAWLIGAGAVSFVLFLVRLGSYLNASDEKRANDGRPQ